MFQFNTDFETSDYPENELPGSILSIPQLLQKRSLLNWLFILPEFRGLTCVDKVVVAMATQIFGAGLRGVSQDQSGEIQFYVPTCPRG